MTRDSLASQGTADVEIPEATFCQKCQQMETWQLFWKKFDPRAFSMVPFDSLRHITARRDCTFCHFVLVCLENGNLADATIDRYGEPFVILEQSFVYDLRGLKYAPTDIQDQVQEISKGTDAIYQIFPRITSSQQICLQDFRVFAAMIGNKSLESEFGHLVSRKCKAMYMSVPLRKLGLLDVTQLQSHDGELPAIGVEAAAVRPLIDFQQVHQWFKQCRLVHGDICDDTTPSPHDQPSRLIDVRTNSLVDTGSVTDIDPLGRVEYTTLSYVWGKSGFLTLTTHTSESLYTAGALTPLGLPPTLFQAIEVTRLLGLSYLWIDALCIKQDDEQEMSQEISKMGAIFLNSTVTLVALSGIDVYSGLHGVGSLKRTSRKCLAKYSDGHSILATTLPHVESVLGPSPWSQRGWTFQEKLLSRRCLLFALDQLFFQCRSQMWIEDLDAGQTVKSGSSDSDYEIDDLGFSLMLGDHSMQDRTQLLHTRNKKRKQVLATVRPEADQESLAKVVVREDRYDRQKIATNEYFEVVETYTKRIFTYDTDILNGFQGIVSRLSTFLESTFCAGLPVQCFHRALLWRHQTTQSSRRLVPVRDLAAANPPAVTNIILPSWSWAGWRGQVNYGFMRANLASYGGFTGIADFFILSRNNSTAWRWVPVAAKPDSKPLIYHKVLDLRPSLTCMLKHFKTTFIACRTISASARVDCLQVPIDDEGFLVKVEGLKEPQLLKGPRNWLSVGVHKDLTMLNIAESRNQTYVMLVEQHGCFWERIDVMTISKSTGDSLKATQGVFILG